MNLTSTTLMATNDRVIVTFNWDDDVRDANSVLWTVTAVDQSGGLWQLGYKLVDGEFSAQYIFDFTNAKQTSAGALHNLERGTLTVEFQPAAGLDFKTWTWHMAVLTIDGEDVASRSVFVAGTTGA